MRSSNAHHYFYNRVTTFSHPRRRHQRCHRSIASHCPESPATGTDVPNSPQSSFASVRSFKSSDDAFYDIVIVGAGAIGLAVARALAKATNTQPPRGTTPHTSSILVLDKGSTIGSATSSRNSEVIHAGLYYDPSTLPLKARTCVRGNQLLYDYCRQHNIPHNRCGKLVVATQPEHFATLYELQHQARSNGVLDTEILHDPRQIQQLEPNLMMMQRQSPSSVSPSPILGALLSPSTGILDSHLFYQQLQVDAEKGGNCTFVLRTTVDDAVVEAPSSRSSSRSISQTLHTNNNQENCDNRRRNHLSANGTWVSCRWVINCAGLWATPMAQLLHRHPTSTTWQPPRQYFARGNYFRLQSSASSSVSSPLCSRLIYPVPDPRGGLGIHLTLDCGQPGRIKFGPDIEWVDASVADPDAIDLKPNMDRMELFYESIRKYWPDLPDGALVPDYVGIRPKLSHPSLLSSSTQTVPSQDFVIAGPETHGVPGVIHLFGIESPGLSSSMAIAEHVTRMVTQRP